MDRIVCVSLCTLHSVRHLSCTPALVHPLKLGEVDDGATLAVVLGRKLAVSDVAVDRAAADVEVLRNLCEVQFCHVPSCACCTVCNCINQCSSTPRALLLVLATRYLFSA